MLFFIRRYFFQSLPSLELVEDVVIELGVVFGYEGLGHEVNVDDFLNILFRKFEVLLSVIVTSEVVRPEMCIYVPYRHSLVSTVNFIFRCHRLFSFITL